MRLIVLEVRCATVLRKRRSEASDLISGTRALGFVKYSVVLEAILIMVILLHAFSILGSRQEDFLLILKNIA